jgi:tRNA A-37 threonylcarbamoyl transferase component Bud32
MVMEGPGEVPVHGRPVRFGKYILVEKLAQGGMAEIFRAVLLGHSEFQKTVALKRILPGYGDLPDFRDRFTAEARLAADLTHSNVVQVLEFGEVDDRLYLVMELVDGLDAERLLGRARQTALSLALPGAFIIAQAARGLAYAHAAEQGGKPLGLVHRDVSPQNILVSYSGEVKITDFGIAKTTASYQAKTASGAVMGKLRYMAPEQVAGLPLDGRADVFALGLVLWELIVGDRLLDDDSPARVVDRIKTASFPAPSARAGGVPPELDRIVARALEGDRDRRYQGADELARDLERFLRAHAQGFGREDLAALMSTLAPRAPAAPIVPLSSDHTPLPPPFIEESAPLRWEVRARGSAPAPAVAPAAAPEPTPTPAPAPRTGRVLAIVLASAAVLAAAVVVTRGDPPPPAVTVAPPAPAPSPAPPAPAPDPEPVAAPPVAPPVKAPAPAAETRSRRRRLDGKPVVLEDELAADLEPADAADVGRARAACRRGDRLLAAGDGAAAERVYQQALEIYPGYIAAYRGLGKSYALQGNPDLAIAMLRTYLRQAPLAPDVAAVRRLLRELETDAELPGRP